MRNISAGRGVLGIMMLVLMLAGCAGEPPRTGPADQRVSRSVAAVRLDPAEALARLNAYRASHGLKAVRLDPVLSAMAARHAKAMAAAGTLSHDVGGSFSTRLAAAGLDTVRAGENLGGGYLSTQEAFEGWRRSSGHNANLLLADATRFGIAIAKAPATRYRVYWAMVVAADPLRPRDDRVLRSATGEPVRVPGFALRP
jgi:uncharacterized protein YkwD